MRQVSYKSVSLFSRGCSLCSYDMSAYSFASVPMLLVASLEILVVSYGCSFSYSSILLGAVALSLLCWGQSRGATGLIRSVKTVGDCL